MARKRMIDPSIWTDEGMAELEPRQQLLYIGLISNADDDGRLKASPLAISLMLPTLYSARDRGVIGEDLQSVLSCMTQLVQYEVDGRPYLAFKNYRQWQRIDKPTKSHLPPPPEETPQNQPKRKQNKLESDSTPGGLDEDSTNDPGALPPNRKEGNRREGNKGADAPQAKRATQVPQDFTLSENLVKWGADPKQGFTVAQMESQIPRFVDHYTAKGEPRKDWDASFRTWMRNAREFGHLNRPNNVSQITGSNGANPNLPPPGMIGPAARDWSKAKYYRDHPDKLAELIEAEPDEAKRLGLTG